MIQEYKYESQSRPEILQLYIESRGDMQQNQKNPHKQQDQSQLSWQLLHSEISIQNTITQQNTHHQQYNQTNTNILPYHEDKTFHIKQNGNHQNHQNHHQNHQNNKNLILQNIEQSTHPALLRDIQILQNKFVSNNTYIKMQLQQLLQLTSFRILNDQQQQLKYKIACMNTYIRKYRLRASGSRGVNRGSSINRDFMKSANKIETIYEQVREEKKKGNLLATRLVLLDNYLKINQDGKINNKGHNLFHQITSTQYQLQTKQTQNNYTKLKNNRKMPKRNSIKSLSSGLGSVVGSSSKVLSLSKNITKIKQAKQAYYSIKQIQIHSQSLQSKSLLLEQHIQLLQTSLTNTKQHIKHKTNNLLSEITNLRKQLDNTKQSLIFLTNKTRSISSARSNRKLSYRSNKNLVLSLQKSSDCIKGEYNSANMIQSQHSPYQSTVKAYGHSHKPSFDIRREYFDQ